MGGKRKLELIAVYLTFMRCVVNWFTSKAITVRQLS
jgi:hypothetical protein